MSGTKFAKHFEIKARGEESFVTLRDDAPEWLRDAVYAAHAGTWAADWVYRECLDAVEAFDSGRVPNADETHGHSDAQVDIYTKSLFKWAADMCLTDLYAQAEESAQDTGLSGTVVEQLQVIQYYAIDHIVRTMVQACVDACAALEGGEA